MLNLPTFQFHKGTIRTHQRPRPSVEDTNFNSIKVRLEQESAQQASQGFAFQFHKGTIRTVEQPSEDEIILISIP